MPLHSETLRSLTLKNLNARHLALLLECLEEHAASLIAGDIEPSGRELAVMRLCANVPAKRLASVLRDLEDGHEWRRVPGFSKYEVRNDGVIRRASSGHGSMPGHVLKCWPSPLGHMRVNIAPDGQRTRAVFLHQAVCLAFKGPPPSPAHVVCHRNDIKTDNRAENLYWGTHQQNADDRVRNTNERLSGTPETHDPRMNANLTQLQVKKIYKYQMLRRLARA